MLTDLQEQKASLSRWLLEGATDNQSDMDKLKQMVPIAIKECCTEKQRLYITHYFADQLTMKDIAALYGVNKSSVSRVIRNGLRRMYLSPSRKNGH